MNLQQIEYLLALDKYRNFSLAAEKMFVTQPALTIQIKNLENELGVEIFDRNKKPIIPTEIGKALIDQARIVIKDTEKLKDVVSEFRAELSGELRVGIIPTVAPYLVPRFVNVFASNYPDVKLIFKEKISEEIIEQLKEGTLDAGILVTPYQMSNTLIFPLYYEKFYPYISEDHPLSKRKRVKTSELNIDDLWLLKEGNCFRNQVINICSQDIKDSSNGKFKYESLSIDSLMKIVDGSNGVTVIPEFAKELLPKEKGKMVKSFSDYLPSREVSLVIDRTFLKRTLIEKLKEAILNSLPKNMLRNKGEIIDTEI